MMEPFREGILSADVGVDPTWRLASPGCDVVVAVVAVAEDAAAPGDATEGGGLAGGAAGMGGGCGGGKGDV